MGPPASPPHSATLTPPMYPSPRPTPPTYIGAPPASQGIPPGRKSALRTMHCMAQASEHY